MIFSIFTLVGGLGLFLYGMRLMGDGLTNAAGAQLRNLLDKMTRNVLLGTVVGALFTAVIQSSSATTSLVVGFVNAQLMNLYQAAGVIMGANIGTTITGILMTINLTAIAPLIIFVGVVMIQFTKDPTINKIGQIIFGFGVLFFGLSTMSSALNEVKDAPIIVNTLTSLTNPILAILIGAGITAILQSASAMVGILIVLVTQGLLTSQMAFYLTLGCNIGCTVTAFLASVGGSVDGRRAATIHLTVNVAGTCIMVVLFALFMPQIYGAIAFLSGSASATGAELMAAYGRDVAYFNTFFNIFQVIVFLPFYKQIVHFVMKVIPDNSVSKHGFTFEFINDKAEFSNTTAIPLVIDEIERTFNMALDNLNLSVRSLLEVDTSTLEEIEENDQYVDFLVQGINDYLRFANTLGLPDGDSMMVGPLFNVIFDIDRFADHVGTITDMTKRCEERNIIFTEDNKRELREILTLVNSELEYSIDMFSKKSLDHLNDILTLEEFIDKKEREMQQEILSDMRSRKTKPRAGMLYSDLASNLEKVADYGANIAFSILNEDSEEVAHLIEEDKAKPSDFLL